MKSQKPIKKGITLLLILAMTLSLIVVGSAAHWSNHSTIPTATSNTATIQGQTVTFGQSASWTNKGAGKAAVNLTFDGAEYVMNEGGEYDFALIFDGSSSPNETACKESAKIFVTNMLAQNPDARFTVIKNDNRLPVYIQNSNNQANINTAITNMPWTNGTDFVQSSCEKAYDLHATSGRTKDLMIVIIGDGDFAYVPHAWTTNAGMSFTTNYRGDTYTVTVSRVPYFPTAINGTLTHNGVTYYASPAGDTQTTGNYSITKNGASFSFGGIKGVIAWCRILYFNEYCYKNMSAQGVAFASICAPKDYLSYNYSSYQATVDAFPANIVPRYAVDEGYNFEITSSNQAGYINAFSQLQNATATRVATLSTTIDNRYFTVDTTALAAGLPADCTYTVTSATRNGVAVQDVQIIYKMTGATALNVSVSVPVTIKSNIAGTEFPSHKHLPVVYDGTAANGAAGCAFTDVNGTSRNIRTRQVYIDATSFAPAGYDITFNANFPTGATNSQPGNIVTSFTPNASLGNYASVFGGGNIPTSASKTYTFAGWYTSASGGTQVTTATSTRTVYAHWNSTDVTYTVNFNTNGGSGSFPALTKTHGVALTLPSAEPTRSNYVFLGWAETQGATTGQYQASGSFTKNANVTLYAIWGNPDYNITFNANFPASATNSQPSNTTVPFAPNASLGNYASVFGGGLRPSSPDKTYTFAGWYTSASGGTKVNTATSTQTVYAQWNITDVTYTVNFNTNGGSGSFPALTKTHGVALTLPSAEPTRSDYIFLGWAETQGATTGQYQASGSFTKNADVTLYAVWGNIPNYNIVFNANFPGDTTNSQPGNSSISVAPGANLIATYEGVFGSGTAPTANGKTYTFIGWYSLSSGGQRVYTADNNQTVYAQWDELSTTCTVTFDTNGGSGDFPPLTKAYGVALTLPTTKPVRTEYVFMGWAEAQNATTAQYQAGGSYTSDDDVTLYAVWEKVTDVYAATAENVILRGDWEDENSGDVVFWVSYKGAPITQTELNRMTITCAPALRWQEISRVFHVKGAATLTGMTDGIYAQVKVAVDVNASGVSAVTMELSDVELATGYVITPGDVSAIYGTINASDSAAMTRVINNLPGTAFPQKGLANNFDFEMMDLTKDNLINAADMAAMSRLVNQIAWIRFTP